MAHTVRRYDLYYWGVFPFIPYLGSAFVGANACIGPLACGGGGFCGRMRASAPTGHVVYAVAQRFAWLL